MERFRQESSLSINISKTKAMWIGAARHNQHSLENIDFVKSLTILGVDVSYSPNVYSLQLQTVLRKIKGQLNLWRLRNLSLTGWRRTECSTMHPLGTKGFCQSSTERGCLGGGAAYCHITQYQPIGGTFVIPSTQVWLLNIHRFRRAFLCVHTSRKT